VSGEVTYVRSEDLLDDSVPSRAARKLGLSRRRQLSGLGLALIALPLLTLLLDALDDQLALDGQVLLYLLVVVAIAVVGGAVAALLSAIAAALLINYFFVDPVHTLTVADPDQVVTLFVFVAVAALVSGAVEIAIRRAQAAERARAEAETMSTLAGPDLSGEESLHEVLRHAMNTFRMETVALKVREPGSSEWVDADRVGWGPPGEEAPLRFDLAAGPRLRLVGRGPALFAEDEHVLETFAAAARTAYEGHRLSGEAEEARTLATVDKQRTALLAAVGHDLRTPLAAIKASVTTLRQTDVDWSAEEREELLATIEDSTDRLDTVVRNLLDASRLQAGSLAVRTEAVALDEIASSAALDLPEAADQLELEVPEDLPLVQADPGLLQRVFVNVLDNAVRHGAANEPVTVRARAGADNAKIEIVDHGPGVPEAARDGLFQPFQRAGDHGQQGLGLGLSIARGFVEAMGGAMVADNTPGGGMTMRIRLPLAKDGDSASHEDRAGDAAKDKASAGDEAAAPEERP
jgi:two-component system, OmpR family, sensor histidine kinase KdpD